MSERTTRTSAATATTSAIVVTYRRHTELFHTLDAIASQSAAVERVVVVDNDADVALEGALSARHPQVIYVSSPSNVGPGGGFALGLRASLMTPTDWYWMLDDDSPPASGALDAALTVATAVGRHGPVGAVGLRGGHIRRGRIRHDLKDGAVSSPEVADFLLVDGSIVSHEAVERVGLPRADFFIMMEDLEYTIRIHEAGLALFVRPADGSRNLYLGSGAPWRGYYQSRNHLRMAIERRSLAWLWGWFVREVAIDLHHLRRRRFRSIRLRAGGAFDAVRNRMGRVVEPG